MGRFVLLSPTGAMEDAETVPSASTDSTSCINTGSAALGPAFASFSYDIRRKAIFLSGRWKAHSSPTSLFLSLQEKKKEKREGGLLAAHSDKHASRRIPKAQGAFKDLMTH